MPKSDICSLCGIRIKTHGRGRQGTHSKIRGVIRVDSRFRAFSISKRRAKFRRERIEF